MVQTNELRENNLFHRANGWKDKDRNSPISFSEEAYRVDSFYYSAVDLSCPDGNIYAGVKITDLKPVALTEEWLLKVGFSKFRPDNELKLFPCFEIQIIASCVNGCVSLMFYTRTIHSDYVPIYISRNIEYVHQLQNLYFGLTWEELIIN